MKTNKKGTAVLKNVCSRCIRLLFPPRCPFCDEIVSDGGICKDCAGKIQYVTEPFCLKCGKQMTDETQEFCEDCGTRRHFFAQARSVLVYDGPVKQSVYRFKYGGRKEYAKVYARMTAPRLEAFVREVKPDCLLPVPLHRKRQRRRGYNQAALYAEALGRLWGIPCRPELARRVENTRPQKQLNPAQRQNNLKKAFNISQNDVKLKTIIIVDDIYTTGSTLDALAALLLQAGAVKVYGITLSSGRSGQDVRHRR